MDPNLSSQLAMNGGAVRQTPVTNDAPRGIAGGIAAEIDNTPRILAGMILGAALTLFLLRVAGFRFSFGASIGGGS